MHKNINGESSHLLDTIRLLRIPFSFFLMPVFLFAVSEVPVINVAHLILAFIILHIFIYPASNGYNSYIDRDEGSIGGLEAPPKPTKHLFYVSLAFDLIGLALALYISFGFFAGILLCVILSRAYSSRWIRLKKYPIIGFFTVVIFQGGFIFYIVYNAVSDINFDFKWPGYLLPVLGSLLIAGIYPMTQVYQHEADKNDGVMTISRLLGIKNTFLFCGVMFLLANIIFLIYNYTNQTLQLYFLFLVFTGPISVFFVIWFRKVIKNEIYADFRNTMKLNLISSFCLALYFITKMFF